MAGVQNSSKQLVHTVFQLRVRLLQRDDQIHFVPGDLGQGLLKARQFKE